MCSICLENNEENTIKLIVVINFIHNVYQAGTKIIVIVLIVDKLYLKISL